MHSHNTENLAGMSRNTVSIVLYSYRDILECCKNADEHSAKRNRLFCPLQYDIGLFNYNGIRSLWQIGLYEMKLAWNPMQT